VLETAFYDMGFDIRTFERYRVYSGNIPAGKLRIFLVVNVEKQWRRLFTKESEPARKGSIAAAFRGD